MKYGLTDIMNNHRWFIMGLAMISVVLFHQPWYEWGPFDFFHRVGFYGVEVFLFVSGWGIYQSLSKNPLKIYFKNRIIRMMPTCILIGVMQAIFCLCGWDNGVYHPLAYVLMCLGLFKWFIYAILLYYALAPCVFRILRQEHFFGLLFAFVLVLIVLCRTDESIFRGSLLSVIPNILYRYPAFLLGMWIAHNPKAFPWFVKAGCLPSLFLGVLVYSAYSSHFSVIINSFVFITATPFLLYITSAMANHLISNILYRCISVVGLCSLEVYLWHDFFFRGFAEMEAPESLLFLLSFIATLLLVIFTKSIVYFLSAKITRYDK